MNNLTSFLCNFIIDYLKVLKHFYFSSSILTADVNQAKAVN